MEILSQLKTIDTTRGTTGRKTWIMKEFGKKYYEISAYISMDGNGAARVILTAPRPGTTICFTILSTAGAFCILPISRITRTSII